jgi:hypothetical protein
MAIEETKKSKALLAYQPVGKIFFLAGIGGGLITGFIYVLVKRAEISFLEALLIVIGAPILHAFTLFVYSVIGYGIYSFCAKRSLFGLHLLQTVQKNKGG